MRLMISAGHQKSAQEPGAYHSALDMPPYNKVADIAVHCEYDNSVLAAIRPMRAAAGAVAIGHPGPTATMPAAPATVAVVPCAASDERRQRTHRRQRRVARRCSAILSVRAANAKPRGDAPGSM